MRLVSLSVGRICRSFPRANCRGGPATSKRRELFHVDISYVANEFSARVHLRNAAFAPHNYAQKSAHRNKSQQLGLSWIEVIDIQLYLKSAGFMLRCLMEKNM